MSPIAPEVLRNAIARQLGAAPDSLSFFNQGLCHQLWRVSPREGGQFLVKAERPEAQEKEANDLLTEAALLRQLHQSDPNLPIPQVLWVDASVPLFAYPMLPGTRMSEAWPRLHEEQRLALMQSIGRVQARLSQSLNASEAQALGLKDHRQETIEPEELEDLQALLTDARISPAQRSSWQQALEVLAKTEHLAVYAFCHNDSHHDNVLVDQQGRLTGILDFGDADYGDVHRELLRYVLDYPQYAGNAVQAFEQALGIQLSWPRIQALAVLQNIG